jgi:ribonuclease D
MSIPSSIDKEEINKLPIVTFPGEIVVIDTDEKAQKAVEELSKEEIIGFDTETRPSFTRGISYKVSLVQLSSEKKCYLFRINKIGFSGALEQLLSSKEVTKIGLSLHDDISALNKRKAFNPAGFIDVQDIAINYGILDLSLQKIYGILFGEKISKSQRLSNWEADELSDKQKRYAATDAWTTRNIYFKLKTLPKHKIERPKPIPPMPKVAEAPSQQI